MFLLIIFERDYEKCHWDDIGNVKRKLKVEINTW
jgi:hypothetical protein